MLPVVELRARIVQVREVPAGGSIFDNESWFAKRRRPSSCRSDKPMASRDHGIQKISCTPRLGAPLSCDWAPLDATDLPDAKAASC